MANSEKAPADLEYPSHGGMLVRSFLSLAHASARLLRDSVIIAGLITQELDIPEPVRKDVTKTEQELFNWLIYMEHAQDPKKAFP
jgi:hypothetical protein